MSKAKPNTLDALRALIAERQQYEQWISALEAKRDGTPEHVFERVHNDYRSRHERVVKDIRGYADELQLNISTLSSRLVEVAREEDTRREGLQEAELRAAVGEYEPQQWEQLRSEAEESLGKIAADREQIDNELSELRAIQKLSEVGSTGTVPPTPSSERPAVAVDIPRNEPGEARASAPAAGAAAAGVTTAAESPPAVSPPGVPASAAPAPGATPLDIRIERVADGDSGSAAHGLPSTHMSAQSIAAPEAARENAQAAQAVQHAAQQGGQRGSSRTPQERVPLEPVAAAASSAASAAGKPRSAKTPPGGVSASRRTEPPRPDATKTLKCPECGTPNYPTEWYCERCGGELATM